MGPGFRNAVIAVSMSVIAAAAQAQEQSLEYQLQAAYLYNFVKFVDWPAGALIGAITICTAGETPVTAALEQIVRDEVISGHRLAVRSIEAPQSACNVVFVPRDVSASEYLRSARSAPVLTVGESPDFIAQGGIINFVRDAGMMRFEIDQEAAGHARLQISSRLLRLARTPARAVQR
jgi:YfiR/HmsC-like